MSSTDLGGASFAVVLRGYDRRQVDERLRFLGAELAAAEHALGSAHERTAAAEDELARVRAQGGAREPAPTVGERVDRMLRLAEEEADDVRSRAQEQAASYLRQAQQEAQRLVAEATAVAQQRERDAHRNVQHLGAVREEVQARLLETQRLLDGHLPALQEATGGAPAAGTARMDQTRPHQGEGT
ncbi:MAG: DivIVA domain-containing protein [Actinomycetota bacterium]|nr:DivIVA domain-containing protein [Actinomycetota bacterium]